jgi:chaperonin GroEL
MKEKKDRLDDALQATKAALDEGILPGAGVALLKARQAITYIKADGVDFNKGKQIVTIACSAPLAQILSNAGENYYDVLLQLKDAEKNMVPNIADQTLVNAFEAGIIDPTKVVRSALENAAYAAVTLLMTECTIHDNPEDKKKLNNELDLSNMMG